MSPDQVPAREQEVGGEQENAPKQRAAHEGGGEDASDAASADGESGECWLAGPQDGHHEQESAGGAGNQVAPSPRVEAVKLVAQEVIDQLEALSVEGRECDEHGSDEPPADQNAGAGVAETADEVARDAVHPAEPDGGEATQDGKRQVDQHRPIPPRQGASGLHELFRVDEQGGREEGGQGGDEQGDEAGGGEVDHDDLHRKDDGGERGLEHGGQGGRGRTSDEHQPVPVFEVEAFRDFRSDGRAALDRRGLETGTASEPHRHERRRRRADHGHPGESGTQPRQGVEGGGNARPGMPAPEPLADEHVGQDEARDRQEEEEFRGAFPPSRLGKGTQPPHAILEQDGKQSGGHADQAREQDERVGRPEPVPELSLQVVKATEDSRFLLRLACHGFFLRHPSRMRTPQTRMSSTCSSSASLRQASIRCRSSSS